MLKKTMAARSTVKVRCCRRAMAGRQDERPGAIPGLVVLCGLLPRHKHANEMKSWGHLFDERAAQPWAAECAPLTMIKPSEIAALPYSGFFFLFFFVSLP